MDATLMTLEGADLPRHDFKSQGMPKADGGPRDIIYAILFVVHVLIVALLLVLGIRNFGAENDMLAMMGGDANENPLNADSIGVKPSTYAKMFGVLAALCAGATVVALGWLWIAKRYPKQLIYVTLVLSFMLWVALALMALLAGNIIFGVLGLLGAALMAFCWYSWRHRIPFAALVLTTVVVVSRRYSAMTILAFFSLLVTFVWSMAWGITVVASNGFAKSAGLAYIVYLFLLLSFYWTSQVIRNVVHVTCCGVYATWYFMSAAMPSNPTAGAAKRAMTTSFGSICLGSLIVALIQTLRAVVRGMRNERNAILICIIDCILGCLEGLVRYFNRWAYTIVAIYGRSYCESAKMTYQLFQREGGSAIMNDSLLSGIFTIGAMIGGLLCAALGFALGWAVFDRPDCSEMMMAMAPAAASTTTGGIDTSCVFIAPFVSAVIGFLIGFVTLSQTLAVIDSGIATIFVCYFMDPQALRNNQPELYAEFREKWHH